MGAVSPSGRPDPAIAAASGALEPPASLRAEQAGAFLREAGARLGGLPAGGTLRLDLSALEGFDSSAVAALVALARRANRAGASVTCLNVPPNLRKLAALYGVDRILFGE